MCLAEIRCVLELEAVRVDRQDRGLAPGNELRARTGFAARGIRHPRVVARRASRSEERLRPGLELAGDLDAPTRLVGSNLEGKFSHARRGAPVGLQRSIR